MYFKVNTVVETKILQYCSQLAKDIDNVCSQVAKMADEEAQNINECKFKGERFLIGSQLATKFRTAMKFENFHADSYCGFVLTQTNVA